MSHDAPAVECQVNCQEKLALRRHTNAAHPARCAALSCLPVGDAEGVQGAWRTAPCEQGDARGSAER